MCKIIYAIVKSDDNNEVFNRMTGHIYGINGKAIYGLYYKNTGVITSDFMNEGRAPDKETALEYAGIIEGLARHTTLLPVRFGTLMNSDKDVSDMLVKNHDAFFANLLFVDGKHEFGLKVMCDIESIVATLEEQACEKDTASGMTETSPGTGYIWSKVRKHRCNEVLMSHVEKLTEPVLDRLSHIKSASKIRIMTSRNIILEAALLVEKRKKKELIETVESLMHVYPGFNFMLTGPWPPYNFTDAAMPILPCYE